jgi:two-component system phosphate regulon sensor histidine kinase PhoR
MARTPITKPAIAELEHERLTTLVNSMVDGVLAVDEKIRIVEYNGAALNILDLNGSIQNKPLGDILKVYDKNNQPVNIVDIIRGTTVPTVNRDLLLHYAKSDNINLYLSVAPVRLGFGQEGERGFVLLLRDITREKSLEEERDEFISVVSHELRTPIAIAEGNISNAEFIVGKSSDITQVQKALQEAHHQILFLADMINDLSTLSRAERGTLAIDIEPINVHDLIIELQRNYQADAEAKKLTLTVDIDPSLELLQSSKLYVHEVLQNFITNALKYTQKGTVSVAAKKVPKGVEFKVHDSGIGISKGDQEKIFDKFFRSEDYRTRSTSGTGLGLYVTMKLARMLHAEINISSQLNRGSTFTIFIPDLS